MNHRDVIRKAVGIYHTYEGRPNDNATQLELHTEISAALRGMQHVVVCDATNNYAQVVSEGRLALSFAFRDIDGTEYRWSSSCCNHLPGDALSLISLTPRRAHV